MNELDGPDEVRFREIGPYAPLIAALTTLVNVVTALLVGAGILALLTWIGWDIHQIAGWFG